MFVRKALILVLLTMTACSPAAGPSKEGEPSPTAGGGGSSGEGGQAGAPVAPPAGGAGASAAGGSGGAGGMPMPMPVDAAAPGEGPPKPVPPESDAAPAVDTMPSPPAVSDPGTEGDGDAEMTGPYVSPPEATLPPGVTAGRLVDVEVESRILAGRTVQVYIPQGYVDGTPAPFMVLHDGPSYIRNFKLNTVLDTMIARKELPLMIAIFVPNGSGQRSFEYDSLTDLNVRFMLEDVLPAVEKALPVKLTTDPEGRAAGGHSSGGIAAFTMGWHRPDQFRRILTHSGSFVNIRGGDRYPALVREAEAKPLRVFLSVGTRDLQNGRWQKGNEDMAAALTAKNYHYRFVLQREGTHAQSFPAAMLPDNLRWLWRGYPVAGK